MPSVELPLPTLLSQVLVAFTVEFDNEFEHWMPHRTTWGPATKSGKGPWLVSLVMWSNFMQFVRAEGIPVHELYTLTGMTKESLEMTLTRMGKWWGYVIVEPDPSDTRAKPPPRDWIVCPTRDGRKAQELWRPLFGIIEERWQVRFGEDTINRLRESLSALVRQFDENLPEYLPVFGHGAFIEAIRPATSVSDADIAPRPHLTTLLSQVLLACTLEFEQNAPLSLGICANIIRLLDETGVPVRDLPRLSGIAKEAITNSVGNLERQGYLAVERNSTDSKTKLARLTPKGLEAQETYRQKLGVIEENWKRHFGSDTIRNLREVLESLVGDPTAKLSPLFRGLEPYPDGWRASIRNLETFPHHPMVLHRGGFPDGS